ncbi:MAG: gamma-glutamyl-gamma-aminobutyrate hydrolase family protein [Spirochaetaceae bacterium]|nr:MAG: gamma-glutamyl-gamma-aminobutyrate hydrolase family protein [Spirochaetaceae bacterium]
MTTATGLPLIGLPCRNDRSLEYNETPVYAQSVVYMRAIVQAGGVPFLIPLNLPRPSLRRLYDVASGILLTGGGDIDPPIYGAGMDATLGDVQPDRDRDEIAITRWAMADRRPLMGICRGIQVIAVTAGGSLIQDIPSEVPGAVLHAEPKGAEQGQPNADVVHTIAAPASSRLAQIVGAETISVNSFHHQAVRAVPAPLKVVGTSPDGMVEAIEHPDHPFLIGVQWHPELLIDSQESAVRIFCAFVQACSDLSALK